ncbi:CoA transferase [Sphaerisporangium sp. NPDC049002]|uniref:CoA transferase n=1 Tax=unclassified Sphaerisporangium TaxID=2630420 RepID=UPI0034118A89
MLDLTRVIAGPVATRTLAAYGAEVLRVGAAHLPEVPGLVISTAFGKRSCELDLRTEEGAAAFRELVAGADVVVQSYRPGALEALGFGQEELAVIRPGIVCVDVSAYGSRGPWAGRRGFDSLVQMACGIAHEGGAGRKPVPLPAQVLDHATGWLAALGVIAGLSRREAEGGSWHVEVALARTALWLDGFGRVDDPGHGLEGGDPFKGKAGDPVEPEVDDLLGEMESPFGRLTYVKAPGRVDGVRPYWSSPPPRRGAHPPAWG